MTFETNTDDLPATNDSSDDGSEEAAQELAERKSKEDFARMLDASFKQSSRKLSPGDKIRGEILVIGKEEAFVSTGTMNDGALQRKDLLDKDGQLKYKVGDVIDVYVTYARGSEVRVSTQPTAKNIADDLEDAFDMMLAVEGRVSEVCKGGVRVMIQGKSAFCPISQLDLRFVEKPDEYVGKKFEFKITQFSEGGRNIVVSRRKVLEEQKGVAEETFGDEHKIGDILSGTVTRVEKFGAFVEVAPGVEGLVHVSELAWSRVADPHEVVSHGQQVSVKLLKTERIDGKLKLSLSIKQAGGEPWANLPAGIQEGGTVEGKVTKLMKFGAFVELAPGIEGLVPLSEMSYSKRVMRAEEVMKEGTRVSVLVKEVHPDTRRISLSLRDAGGDPWAMVPHKFKVGAIVPGKVERREPYGLFIKLDEGITGLLPKSKAMEQPEFPFEKLKIGEQVTVQIGELRLEERRISLDVPKDPGADEWRDYAAKPSGSFGTLGDQLKKAMEKKKS